MFANDHCTGKLNYVKLIRESIWFAMIDSRIDSVRNILIRCTPSSYWSDLMMTRNDFTKCNFNCLGHICSQCELSLLEHQHLRGCSHLAVALIIIIMARLINEEASAD